MNDAPHVGFYVRNAFQVSHLRPIFRATPNATWLLRSSADAVRFGIDDAPIVASRFFMRRTMEKFDAVVSHTCPPGNKSLAKTPTIMVQYGYAKEPYNFGEWRKRGQAVCAYGPYGVRGFAPHVLAYATGNPRWDDWTKPDFAQTARAALPDLEPDRPVVLYAPTWGELSSLPDWCEAVRDLSTSYTVLIKAHHNAAREGQLQFIETQNHVHDVSNTDLMGALAVADVLISDYSGAIFDGILCGRPVVLLDVADIVSRFGDKLDGNSLEMARRDELGVRVQNPPQLADAVATALKDGPRVSDALKNDLFCRPASVAEEFLAILPEIIAAGV